MNTGLLILAGIVALIGLACLWFWKRLRDEVALMAATPTSRAADVAAMAPGTIVEVKGTIRCEALLTAEFSKKPCVYHKSEIIREEVRHRDGKRETHTTVEKSNIRHAPFVIEDDSGRVRINAEKAQVEAVEVFDENADSLAGSVASVAGSLMGLGSSERRMKESILAPDIAGYVLGTVQADGSIGAAPKGAKVKEFIISYKSEEERTKDTKTLVLVMLIITIVVFIGAAAALYYAIVTPPAPSKAKAAEAPMSLMREG